MRNTTKRLVLFLIFLSFNSYLFSQKIDHVKIYVIPFITDYAFEGIVDASFVRVHHKYAISITDPPHVEEIVAKYNAISKEQFKVVNREDINGCRLVIDFIRATKIIESVVIDRSYKLSFDEPYSKSKVYSPDNDFICYLHANFPTIVKIYHNGIDCSP